MAEQTIKCPKCGFRISVAEELTRQIETELRKTFEAEADKIREEAQGGYQEKLAVETAKLKEQARKEAERAASAALTKMQSELAEVRRREKALQASFEKKLLDVQLRVQKQAREAAEKKVSLATEKLESEYRMRQRELEKQLSDAKQKAAELERKLEQSPPGVKGDVGELELGMVLERAFPGDKIEPIAKGKVGADVLQKVYTSSGQYCGAIIWESKNTQNWSKAWLAKLRSDQRRAKAELAVLVSTALPKDVRHFDQVDGIWVTEFPLALGVGTALRTILMEVARVKPPGANLQGKMNLLYKYLLSTEFRHRIEAIVESFRSMQDDLARERETAERQWAKREKQIQLIIQGVSGMYKDFRRIVESLPKIPRLELPAPSES